MKNWLALPGLPTGFRLALAECRIRLGSVLR